MNEAKPPSYRGWEYSKKGDYHCKLDPNWSYTPSYLHKMIFVRQKIQDLRKDAKILDAGCGEGVLDGRKPFKKWFINLLHQGQ